MIISDKRIISSLRRQIREMEKDNRHLRVLLQIAREHVRQSPAPDAKIILAKLNGRTT